MTILTMDEVDLAGKRVLIREDLNVPLKEGVITSDARIRAALPTIQKALAAGAAVMILSHLGRPTEGECDPQFSLEPVANALGQLLGQPVRLVSDWLSGVSVKPGEVVLCENVRFNVGEKKNAESLAKQMAALCDVFVMDAFATAHRAQASTEGVARFAPEACAGPLLMRELNALNQALTNTQHPFVAIVGGAKVSSKLVALEHLLDKVDTLIVGGGIANTFLAATGVAVGKSLYEKDLIDAAKRIMQLAKERGVQIPLPSDVVVATACSADAEACVKGVDQVNADEMILDIGPDSAQHISEMIMQAKTVVWNGPVGVFEYPAFEAGTKSMSKALAASSAFTVTGGGDTLAAIDRYQIADKISYISTGGGAFLEVLEGKTLPAVAVLDR